MNNIEAMKQKLGMAQPNRGSVGFQEALAQPEQDWSMLEAMQGSLREHMARIKELESQLAQQAEPVYITPPQGIYYTPPQRQPLTKKEVFAIIDKHPAEKKILLPMFYRDQVLDICRDIEQAHGIKEEI